MAVRRPAPASPEAAGHDHDKPKMHFLRRTKRKESIMSNIAISSQPSTPQPGRRSWRTILLVVAILALIGLTGWFAYQTWMLNQLLSEVAQRSAAAPFAAGQFPGDLAQGQGAAAFGRRRAAANSAIAAPTGGGLDVAPDSVQTASSAVAAPTSGVPAVVPDAAQTAPTGAAVAAPPAAVDGGQNNGVAATGSAAGEAQAGARATGRGELASWQRSTRRRTRRRGGRTGYGCADLGRGRRAGGAN